MVIHDKSAGLRARKVPACTTGATTEADCEELRLAYRGRPRAFGRVIGTLVERTALKTEGGPCGLQLVVETTVGQRYLVYCWRADVKGKAAALPIGSRVAAKVNLTAYEWKGNGGASAGLGIRLVATTMRLLPLSEVAQ